MMHRNSTVQDMKPIIGQRPGRHDIHVMIGYRSMTIAIPIPPPMHMDTIPVEYPFRRIWFMPLTI